MHKPQVSLIIGTLGRDWQLERLFASLSRQSLQSFEVIVVDQNEVIDLAPILNAGRWSFPITHEKVGPIGGLSPARNLGWNLAKADVLLFPDDDAWYPEDFLERGVSLMGSNGFDILTGRSTDTEGRTINGRFSKTAGFITRRSVWTMQQEWITFVRRDLLQRIGGYDHRVCLGAPTPYQASEGPELILRALNAEARCYYDPTLTAHHEPIIGGNPDKATIAKARSYARGMGFVLRIHRAPVHHVAYLVARSAFNMLRAAAARDWKSVSLYRSITLGRIEGWLGRMIHRP